MYSDMMICPACGRQEQNQTAHFCPTCGTPLRSWETLSTLEALAREGKGHQTITAIIAKYRSAVPRNPSPAPLDPTIPVAPIPPQSSPRQFWETLSTLEALARGGQGDRTVHAIIAEYRTTLRVGAPPGPSDPAIPVAPIPPQPFPSPTQLAPGMSSPAPSVTPDAPKGFEQFGPPPMGSGSPNPPLPPPAQPPSPPFSPPARPVIRPPMPDPPAFPGALAPMYPAPWAAYPPTPHPPGAPQAQRPVGPVPPNAPLPQSGSAGTPYAAPNPPPPPARQAWPPHPIPAPRLAPLAVARPLPAPVAPPRPARQFRWREFVDKNQIAIAAYIGGLLLLAATLFFIFATPSFMKPLIALAGELLFGLLGWGVRHTRLRSVGRAYLLVCALMTPLVGLAAYLAFGGENLGRWLVFLAALYACCVYLALALETRFITYAYLGWVCLLVAAVALVFTLDTSETAWQWLVLALGLLTLALLAPFSWQQRPVIGPLLQPARHLAILTTFLVVLEEQILSLIGLNELVQSSLPGASSILNPWALALGAWALVALALYWRRLRPDWAVNRQNNAPDLLDGLAAVFVAEALGDTAVAMSLPSPVTLSILALIGLLEFVLAATLLHHQPQRWSLRHFVEGLSLAISGSATLYSRIIPNGQWSLVLALTILGAILVGLAASEQRWWLAPGGLALRLAYAALLPVLEQTPEPIARISTDFLLALACWGLALALRRSERTQRFVPPTYVIALGLATYTTLLIFQNLLLPSAATSTNSLLEHYYSVFILFCFAAAAFVAGSIERQLAAGGLLMSAFGLLIPLPLLINDPIGWDASLLALLCALVALFVGRQRSGAGRYTPYGSTLYIGVLAAIHSSLPGVETAAWSLPFLSFTTWLLLALALLAAWAALRETSPWAMLVPAFLAFWATALAIPAHPTAGAVLTFALLGSSAAARQWRGGGWGWAFQFAALLASVLEGVSLFVAGPMSYGLVSFLLAFAIAVYLVAALERQPALTAIAALYALISLFLLPDTSVTARFWFTVLLAFALTLTGLGLRLPLLHGQIRRVWALAPYGVALIGSLLALERGLQAASIWLWLPLLAFAIAAYLAAILEHQPAYSLLAVTYTLAAGLFLPSLTQPVSSSGGKFVTDSWFIPHEWDQIAFTLALSFCLWAIGLALRLPPLRARAQAGWALAPYGAAAGCSFLALERGAQGTTWVALPALAFAVAAYLAAWMERKPALTCVAALYGLAACWFLPALTPQQPVEEGVTVIPDSWFREPGYQFWLTWALTLLIILAALALRLSTAREKRTLAWALAPYLTALFCSFLALQRGVQAAPLWVALALLSFVLLAYLVAALEREPRLTSVAVIYAILAGLFLPNLQANSHTAGFTFVRQFAPTADQLIFTILLTAALFVLGMTLRVGLGPAARAWTLAPYAAALGSSALILWRSLQVESGWTSPALLGLALLTYLAAALERQPLFTAASLVYALLAAALLPAQDQAVLYQQLTALSSHLPRPYQLSFILMMTLASAAIGALLRLPFWRKPVRRSWALAPYATALGCSLLMLISGLQHSTPWLTLPLLGLAVLAYLLAVLEKQPAITLMTAIYALTGALFIPPDQTTFYQKAPLGWLPGAYQFWLTVALTLLATAAAAITRLPSLRPGIQQKWVWALYITPLGCSLLTIWRVPGHDAGRTQALLLVFAAIAYLIVLLEARPWVGILPTAYALAGVIIYPEPAALLPLALSLALLGLLIGRLANIRWSWPFYGASALAAALTAILGQPKEGLGFEAIALLSLAILAYLVAAIESRADMVPIALVLGALALSSGLNFLDLDTRLGAGAATPATIIAFIILGWLYILGQYLWEALPLRPRGILWWLRTDDPAQLPRWRDPRFVGVFLHRWAGVLVGCGSALIAFGNLLAFLSSNRAGPFPSQPLVAALALCSLAGMLALLARTPRFHAAWYFAGGMLALAITCLFLYLGIPFGWQSAQPLLLAPGTYCLLIGALLPTDQRLGNLARAGQTASLAGALLLLLPALLLIFIHPGYLLIAWIALLIEALAAVIWGLVVLSPLLVALGFALVGVAAIVALQLAGTSGDWFVGGVLLIVGALLSIFYPLWHIYLRPRQAAGRQ